MRRNPAPHLLLAIVVLTAALAEARADRLVCLTCHSAPSFRKVKTGGGEQSLHVDEKTLAGSSHAKLTCLECHSDFIGEPFPHKRIADPVNCESCHLLGKHKDAPNKTHIDLYEDSVHGNALKRKDPDAPTCTSCHGTHQIRPSSDPKSLAYRDNIPATCGACHFDAGFTVRHKLKNAANYKDSVHAKAFEENGQLKIAAVCTDCHGVHNIKSHSESDSQVNRLRLPETCGKCHEAILKDYEVSVHGSAFAKGVKNAPTCTDCHGEHLVVKPSSPKSPVYPLHVATTCSKCHEDEKIQKRYGLPTDRLSSYLGSYHGVANKFGDVTVANCSTCHGSHKVLPSSDPDSSVNKKNLPKTCGECHPGAGVNFAKGSIHVMPSPHRDRGVFWVQTIYTLFVVGMIGAFCCYILLDLRARWIGRLPWRNGNHRK